MPVSRPAGLPALALLVALFAPAAPRAQDRPPADSADVASVDGVVGALYAAISGPVGQPRQWDRFYSLMHPDARLVPTGCPPDGGLCRLRVLTPEGYQAAADSFLVAEGFVERELVRRTERYGAVAHAFSSYESYRRGEAAPFARGINSVQLFHDGRRWWVVSVYWDAERPGNPLPPEFEGDGEGR